MKEILDKYLLDYKFVDDNLEVWRNGRFFVLPLKDLNEDNISNVINELCIYSPDSTKKLKNMNYEKFVPPEKGDLIALKSIKKSMDYYSIKEFKAFRNGKIICVSKRGIELVFDFYQIIPDDNHPTTNLWLNACGNSVTWAVMEQLNTYKAKG